MTKNISVLGSTGSIGRQTLDVARRLKLNIKAVTANSSVDLLERQAREFCPELVVIGNEEQAKDLKLRLADTAVKVSFGMEGLCQSATLAGVDTVLNSVVGMIGLKPTLEAINAGKNIALANKETLVAGGSLVMKAAQEKGVEIYPVDSEHSAIFQCLQGCPDKKMLKRLILTASGGPFFGYSYDKLKTVTVEQALSHPNWNMGAKITVDSATMMNKGLEIIEAKWLFDMPSEQIDVVVHRESVIHSMIEFNDNSVIAQMGLPDMKIPIQYALTYPNRFPSDVGRLDLAKISNLTFYEPDYDVFKCLKACKKALKMGGVAPAFANGANEEAVKLFLDKKIAFTDIGDLVESAVEKSPNYEVITIEDVTKADYLARQFVINSVKRCR